MADSPVKSFLDTFFEVHNARQKMLGLDPEMALRRQEFEQRTNQFQQEQSLREREFGQRQDYQNLLEKQRQDQLKDKQNEGIAKFWQDFRDKGGISQPVPTAYSTSQLPATPPLQLPDLPTGISGQGPQQQPAAPLMEQQRQVPDFPRQLITPNVPEGREGYEPIPSFMLPPGAAEATKGNQLLFPSAETVAAQKKEAEEASPEYQPVMARVKDLMGEGAPAKMKLSEQLQVLDAHEKMLDRQQQMLDRQEQSTASMQLRRELADQSNQTRMAIAALSQNKGRPDLVTANYNHNSVLKSPESYADLNKEEKSVENRKLGEEGLPLPVKVPTAVQSQVQASKQVQDQVQGLLQQMRDPEIQPWLGAVKGRAALLGLEAIGDIPSMPDSVKTKLARIQKDFTTLNFSTAKESMPGRLIGSLVTLMSKSNARMNEAMPIIQGHLRGALDTSRAVQVSARRAIGPGWEKRPEFLATLPNQMREATEIPKSVSDAMTPNSEISLKSLGGRRFIKMPDPNNARFNSDGSLNEGSQALKVFEVTE